MIDLQRGMGCIWNIVCGQIQGGLQNSDAGASARTVSRGKLLFN
jgi:hypothetical protein